MRRQNYRLLLLGVILWAFVANVTLIIGREHSHPVAVCVSTDKNNIRTVDALVASPWVKETQFHRLASDQGKTVDLSTNQKGALDAVSALSLSMCVLALIMLVIILLGDSYVSPIIIVAATGVQLVQLALLLWLVSDLNCTGTGAQYASGASFLGFVIALSCNPKGEIIAATGGMSSFYTLNF